VGYFSSEVAMSHGHLASWVEVLAMASDMRGQWAPYVGELWDAAVTPLGVKHALASKA
jgi:hypothetical protein